MALKACQADLLLSAALQREIILVVLTASTVWLQSQGQSKLERCQTMQIFNFLEHCRIIINWLIMMAKVSPMGEREGDISKQQCKLSRESWQVEVGGRGVWQLDTDLLVGVVTLARMVKLLLTVRRLANTWGGVWTVWEENQEAGEREKDRKRKRKGVGWGGQVHRGNYSHLLAILQQLNMSHNVIPEQMGWQSCLQCACRKGGGKKAENEMSVWDLGF